MNKVKSFSLKKAGSVSGESRLDLTFLGAVGALTIFGLFMIFDVSQVKAFQDFGDKYYFIRQQLTWMVLGYVGLFFFSFFDYRQLTKLATPLFLFSVLLLLLVFVPGLGVSAGGAHRWLKISFLYLQPAEIIKLSSVIFVSRLFEKSVRTVLFILIWGAVALSLGIFQKDLGSTVVFSAIMLVLYFMANAPLIHFLGFFIPGLLASTFFVFISPYRKERILAFLNPFADPQGFSYHISQILIALGAGGFLGLGVGQSRQKFSFIPEVTTDSIFSIIGEEFGFLGALMLICLMGFLIIRGFRISKQAPDQFGRLLSIGLIGWIGSQTVVNLAAMVSLIPLTGVPLPFISYGGSSLLTNLLAVGILLNISKQSSYS